MKEFDEGDCLILDPFEGDFGEPSDRVLNDKIVTARKPGTCHLCGGKVAVGSRARAMSVVFYGKMEYFRWCGLCCHAMAKSWEDDGVALERRVEVGRKRETKAG